ncbi:hypothetical protein F4778DRAFT_365866 [Xylariomycetidae sp. FL2044]|nr:hypothetical protein F4778DRAFT_365866 [Xylariomycetidae sp. FL2044]
MRSHPYAPPPTPITPLLDELSTYLPNRGPQPPKPTTRDGNDGEESNILLDNLDPDTSRLLPRKRRQHRVRVQGRLALVRSVSVVNLSSASQAGSDTGVGGGPLPARRRRRRRRRPGDDLVSSKTEDEDECDYDTEVESRDTQFRGYGIGGAGNIRRPTEVMGASSRASLSLSSLFSSSSSGPSSPLSPLRPGRRRWDFADLMERIRDRKGKGNSSSK